MNKNEKTALKRHLSQLTSDVNYETCKDYFRQCDVVNQDELHVIESEYKTPKGKTVRLLEILQTKHTQPAAWECLISFLIESNQTHLSNLLLEAVKEAEEPLQGSNVQELPGDQKNAEERPEYSPSQKVLGESYHRNTFECNKHNVMFVGAVVVLVVAAILLYVLSPARPLNLTPISASTTETQPGPQREVVTANEVENQRLKRENEELKIKLRATDSVIPKLVDVLVEKRAKFDSETKENEKLTKRLEDVEHAVHKLTEQNTKSTQQLQQRESIRKTLEDEHNGLTLKLQQEIGEEIPKTQIAEPAYKQQVHLTAHSDEDKAIRLGIRQFVESLKSQLAIVQNELAQKSLSIDALADENTRLRGSLEETKTTFDSVSSENAHLKLLVQVNNMSMELATRENERLKLRVRELDLQIEMKEKENSGIAMQLNDARKVTDLLTQENERLMKQLEESDKRIRELEKENVLLRERLGETEISSQRVKIATAIVVAIFTGIAAKLRCQAKKLHDRNVNLANEKKQLENDNINLENDKVNLENDNYQLRRNIEQMKKKKKEECLIL